jgi:hypothetical protein
MTSYVIHVWCKAVGAVRDRLLAVDALGTVENLAARPTPVTRNLGLPQTPLRQAFSLPLATERADPGFRATRLLRASFGHPQQASSKGAGPPVPAPFSCNGSARVFRGAATAGFGSHESIQKSIKSRRGSLFHNLTCNGLRRHSRRNATTK